MDDKTRNDDVNELMLENAAMDGVLLGHAFDFWKSEDDLYAAIAQERDIQAHSFHGPRTSPTRDDSDIRRDNDSLKDVGKHSVDN